MAKVEAQTLGALHFGEKPSADFKLGWIIGHAMEMGDPQGPKEVEECLLAAIGDWYDWVFGWDYCVAAREPEMAELAKVILTMGRALDPSEITDPALFGQANNNHKRAGGD